MALMTRRCAAAERVGVVLTVGRAELAEDVRHFRARRRASRRRSEVRGRRRLGRSGVRELGQQVKGLVVAHTVLVAIFK